MVLASYNRCWSTVEIQGAGVAIGQAQGGLMFDPEQILERVVSTFVAGGILAVLRGCNRLGQKMKRRLSPQVKLLVLRMAKQIRNRRDR
jgi:hypothetical protein